MTLIFDGISTVFFFLRLLLYCNCLSVWGQKFLLLFWFLSGLVFGILWLDFNTFAHNEQISRYTNCIKIDIKHFGCVLEYRITIGFGTLQMFSGDSYEASDNNISGERCAKMLRYLVSHVHVHNTWLDTQMSFTMPNT